MGRKLADIRAQEKEHIAMEKSEMPGPWFLDYSKSVWA
jgi:hypothetical protein